jgi:diamine N-acetyltransferase
VRFGTIQFQRFFTSPCAVKYKKSEQTERGNTATRSDMKPIHRQERSSAATGILSPHYSQICRLETLPQFRTFVGSWAADQHLKNLADADAGYLVAEDEQGSIAAFAILRGLLSEHRAVELKRFVVGIPNQGTGKRFLTEIADRAFGEYGAHRLFLDVFVNHDRARHVYESFGFRAEGIMRDAIYRDGTYHSLMLMSLLDGEYQNRAGSNG